MADTPLRDFSRFQDCHFDSRLRLFTTNISAFYRRRSRELITAILIAHDMILRMIRATRLPQARRDTRAPLHGDYGFSRDEAATPRTPPLL
jgi:hypothetical protein